MSCEAARMVQPDWQRVNYMYIAGIVGMRDYLYIFIYIHVDGSCSAALDDWKRGLALINRSRN
jgi:hypothetical protein